MSAASWVLTYVVLLLWIHDDTTQAFETTAMTLDLTNSGVKK